MAVNATEYKAFVEKVVTMASKYNKVNMTMEKELTKRKEAEAEARKAEARIAESNVRLLELQIKMKEIETSSSTRLCDRG
jgi:ribosomal protein L24